VRPEYRESRRPVVRPAIALQFFHELAEGDAQVGFDQIVFRQSGCSGRASWPCRPFSAAVSFEPFISAEAYSDPANLRASSIEGDDVCGAIFQDFVIPRRSGRSWVDRRCTAMVRGRDGKRMVPRSRDVGDENDAV